MLRDNSEESSVEALKAIRTSLHFAMIEAKKHISNVIWLQPRGR